MSENIQIISLPNGARLLVDELPEVHSAAAGIFIQVGSRNETPELSGASHFVEHMLFKGSSRHNARQLAEEFENLGGQNNAYTTKEYTCVYAKTLDEDIGKALELMFEMLFDSSFAESEFATEKKVVLEEINMYEDTPDELVHDVFSQQMYRSFGMGHPVLGTTQSILAMNRDMLYQYYKKYYTASRMIVAISGNVKAEVIQKMVETLMDNQKAEPIASIPQPEIYQTFITCVPKQLEQVHICLGVPGISYQDERVPVLGLMNQVLGGGMSSRLFQSLREQRGLAYAVYSFTSCFQTSGRMGVYIGTQKEKIPEFFAAFYQELERFVEQGITTEELQRTLKMSKSNFYMGLESIGARMSRMARSFMMNGYYETPEETVAKMYRVTQEAVQKLAYDLFGSAEMSLCAIGSPEVLPQVQQSFADWYRK